MIEDTIDRWLRRELRRDANVCLGLAPLAFAGGVVVSGFSFLFCLWAAWLGLKCVGALVSLGGGRWQPTSGWSWALTWTFWLTLMGSGFRRRAGDGDEGDDEFSGDPGQWQSHLGPVVPVASPWVMLMFPKASSRAILDLLHLGPRMLLGCVQLFRESGWLRTAETADAARLLEELAARAGRMDWEDYRRIFEGVDQAAMWRVLRFLPGVVVLDSGVTVTEDLRSLLRAVQQGQSV